MKGALFVNTKGEPFSSKTVYEGIKELDLGAKPPSTKIVEYSPLPSRAELRTKDPDSSTTFNFLLLKWPDIQSLWP